MTNEKILTDEEIIALGQQARAIESGENGYILPVKFARAIEQAVLQSPEIQRLRDIEDQAESIVIRRREDGNYIVFTEDLDRLRVAMEHEK